MAGLSPSHELDGPPSDCFLSQLEFRPVNRLPTQSYICLLGGLLAILDLDELASLPITDELTCQSNTSDSSLVMGVGQRLLNLVGEYVGYTCAVFLSVYVLVWISCYLSLYLQLHPLEPYWVMTEFQSVIILPAEHFLVTTYHQIWPPITYLEVKCHITAEIAV